MVAAAALAQIRKKTQFGRKRGLSEASMHLEEPTFLPGQKKVKEVYSNTTSQIVVAVLIFANFMVNIIEKQIDPQGDKYNRIWQTSEDIFNVIFLIELLINLYGSFFVPFWRSSWNIFDLLVVTVGVTSLLRIDLGPLKLLRVLRAFRVFRLFKRVKSLNKIISSLTKAVPGVLNAFIVMLLVMAIYALLAVEFFADFGESGYYEVDGDNSTTAIVDSMTARGLFYGEEYYGNFMRALFSLFQVLTGESWAEVVVRPLLFGWSAIGGGIFFVSFIILNGIVLINVVVAVLLDNFVSNDTEGPEYSEAAERGSCAKTIPASSQDIDELRDEVRGLKEQLQLVLSALNGASSVSCVQLPSPASPALVTTSSISPGTSLYA